MTPTTRGSARRAAAAVIHEDSDYGSDIDCEAIPGLLDLIDTAPRQAIAVESIEQYNPLPQVARIPRSSGGASDKARPLAPVEEDRSQDEVSHLEVSSREITAGVQYDASNRITFTSRASPQAEEPYRHANNIQPLDVDDDDTRSPLDRFRTKRRRPMSVTDIVSPAWCELQYFYNLAKYGRVQQTPAMRQGSSVHKVLEEEVHVAVPVEVMTREDGFGLRIWNVIQGLRTLRSTGLTREFEVWGIIEGQVVNGIIDQLSYDCPDRALEEALSPRKGRGRPRKSKDLKPAADQTTLHNFMADSSKGASALEGKPDASRSTEMRHPKDDRNVYITDVKTRSSRTLPKDEISLRPTYMQLMLYRRLLTQLATDSVPADRIFSRYHVEPDSIFSDIFISQIGGLDEQPLSDPSSSPSDPPPSRQDPLSELLSHNTLSKLWTLMLRELATTIPTVAPLLRAEYRAAATGAVLGDKIFVHDERRLAAYVADEMAWWTGRRPARGVDIEEAFKCRICAFAEGCSWREEKVGEALARSRLREEGRRAEG